MSAFALGSGVVLMLSSMFELPGRIFDLVNLFIDMITG